MKVLMQIRQDACDVGGGDVVQLEKIADHLSALGIKTGISTKLTPNLDGYDIVNLYNLEVIEDTYEQYLNAKKQNKPIVFSTIYWNKNEYLLNNPSAKVKIAKKIIGNTLSEKIMQNRRFFSRAWKKQREVLRMSDLILATSQKEIEIIQDDFKIALRNYRVVPLGVDTGIFSQADSSQFISKTGLKNFVLCVGRIEDRKNQLQLINAFKERGENLVFIGQLNKNFPDYCNKFLREVEMNENIHYFDHIPQSELASAYTAAKAHIAPSWFETFGLVSLEAMACGTPVVVTERCPFDEFFGDSITYCDPSNPNSIRNAVSLATGKNNFKYLREKILMNFNWDIVGKNVLTVYRELLSKK